MRQVFIDFDVEVWKPIPSTNGKYMASSRGRILSKPKGNRHSTIVVKQWRNRGGYMCVRVARGRQGRKFATVHSLVAEAFLGARPEGMVVNHKDGVKHH